MSYQPKSIFTAPDDFNNLRPAPQPTSHRPNPPQRSYSNSSDSAARSGQVLSAPNPKGSPHPPSLPSSDSPGQQCADRGVSPLTIAPPVRLDSSKPSPGFKRPSSTRPHVDADTPLQKRLRREVSDPSINTRVEFKSPFSRPHTLPSPLFFSNSPPSRPQLPPRLSSSEAGAKMLSRAQGEDANIKTVTLARGTFAPGSPTAPLRPAFESRASSKDYQAGSSPDYISPEANGRSEVSRWLGQSGVTELLEQDARCTFIVDLADLANYEDEGARVIYANAAFRAQPRLVNQTLGRATHSNDETIFSNISPPFRSWMLGITASGELLDRPASAFNRAGFLWSFSTLRKRLRIVNGVPLKMSPGPGFLLSSPPHYALGHESTPMSEQASGSTKSASPGSVPDQKIANDYFGSAVLPTPQLPKRTRGAEPNEADRTNESPRARDINDILFSTSNVRKGSPASSRSKTSSEQSYPSEAVLLAACASNIDALQPSSEREVGFFDWTRLPVSDALPKHIQFARSIDWGATALGPIDTWSADLRQMCNLVMASPHPAAFYWGEDLIAIYNEAYVLLAGQKHPKLMGQSYRCAWAEIWDEVKDVFANAQKTGQATMKDDDCLFIRRSNFLEETYFSWSIIPLVGGDGSVKGLYNPAFEKSRRKIAERRMLTLREVGERTAAARDVKGFWDEVLAALECNEFDTPFVLLYSLHGELQDSDDSSINSSSLTGSRQCYLEGALGVPVGHACAPDTVDLQRSEGFVPIFREVMKTNKPTVLDVTQGELPTHLVEGLEVRGFGDPLKSVVVCPIHPTTGDSTLGFLVMGINPRRPFDEDYGLFVQLLSRQLATSLASVVLFEEEIRRGQKAAKMAALDRIELSEQLAARTQEAIESETKFTRMAEFAPVGMFIASSEGLITYCNDTWFDISRVPKGPSHTDRWIDYIAEDDQALVKCLWQDLVDKTRPATAEFRFKAPWTDRNGMQGETWVLFSAYPEKTEEGTLKSVFASITNISQQKWAEGLQKKKMEEAVEVRRQQENFIDVTSHEMRNPLSAILQCADEIVTSLSDARSQQTPSSVSTRIFDDNIDAAQTIGLCAHHQKRIVDDVLTMSKLDSSLLMVTPVDVQPQTIVQKALKMFEGEVQTTNVNMSFTVDPSFTSMGVDWVKFDPSRVLQVLINLTTNALKFTREKKGTVNITIAASNKKPSSTDKPIVDYFPSRSKHTDRMQSPDWGHGEEIFIEFAVRDTGRGLTDEEKKLLFLRFSQASPRTHVQYGGSGLGLFISRELTELQGGEIGVASEAGKGSTFAFYIRARRTGGPQSAFTPLSTHRPGMPPTNGALRQQQQQQTATLSHDFANKSNATAAAARESDGGKRRVLRVLIVEDNLVNQKVLQKQLRNMGCETHVANHGGEALDRLRESWFWGGPPRDDAGTAGAGEERRKAPVELDVVLMDQEMPVMDGLTATRLIREEERAGRFKRHVPVIAVTANARVEQVQTAMEAGMDDVVSKPFRIPDLIPKIEELVAKHID